MALSGQHSNRVEAVVLLEAKDLELGPILLPFLKEVAIKYCGHAFQSDNSSVGTHSPRVSNYVKGCLSYLQNIVIGYLLTYLFPEFFF